MLPFPGGIESTANGALILSVGAALLYFAVLDQPASWRRSAIKTLAVALLAAVAVGQSAPWLLVAALLLSAAGDYCLSLDGERPFLAGLASFLAAHIAYVVLFAGAGGGILTLLSGWPLVGALFMLGLSLTVMRILLRHVPTAMRAPVLAYCAAILAMGLTALTTRYPPVVAGAAMFMASDAILALERFVVEGPSPLRLPMRFAVWALYYAAQLILTLAVLLA